MCKDVFPPPGTFFYNTNNDTVDLSGEIDQFLYLKSTTKKLIL